MKKLRNIFLIALCAITLSACSPKPEAKTFDDKDLLSGKHHVEIIIKDMGTIKLELDADKAPITTTNFIKLAKEGFYDELTFHRVVKGFMIQGGDPYGDGTGGAKDLIPGEFLNNGYEDNDISHERGVISMARSKDYDSGSSQFFIMQKARPSLDGEYAAFGHVTEGMAIVDKIANKTETQDNNGKVDKDDQPIIRMIHVIE